MRRLLGLILLLSPVSIDYAQVVRSSGWCGQMSPGTISISTGVSNLGCGTPAAPGGTEIIPGQTPAQGTVGVPYSEVISASGGVPPYATTVTAGSLPAGISIGAANSAGAQLSGTPTTAGTSNFTIQVCDTASSCATASFTLIIVPAGVNIPAQTCGNGFVSIVYGCSIMAQGGTTPYSWAVTSGTLPAGLSLATVSNEASISGTPTTAAASSFTLTVTDSSSPAGTATINLAITISATAACGWPTYACSRTDAVARSMTFTDAPPAAGCQTNSNVSGNPCSGGLNSCTGAAGGATGATLNNCGNIYGLNTIITESDYNNVKLVRITDALDQAEGCGTPMIGPGGSAEFNIFEKSNNYVVLSCGGGAYGFKWFNPSTMQIVTTVDPAGWAHTSSGAIYATGSALRFAYNTANTAFIFPGSNTLVQQMVINNGIVGAATTVADFSYAVPCWNAASSTCPDWQASHTYAAGSNIIPSASGTPNHAFQLVNTTSPYAPASCTSGASAPNFQIVQTGTPVGSTQYVISDGTCQWADMWVPLTVAGSSITWTAGNVGDGTDTMWSEGINNHKGQDAAGGCFVVWYNSNTQTYSNFNSCTGNVYNTTCAGGTGYNCAGGTFTQTFVGSAFNSLLNNPQFVPNSGSPAPSSYDLHNAYGNKGGTWAYPNGNDCALSDTSGNYLICPTNGQKQYWWWYGTTKFLDYVSLLSDSGVGHTIPGYNFFIYQSGSFYSPFMYLGRNINSSLAACPVSMLGSSITAACWGYFDLTNMNCQPNMCFGLGADSTVPNLTGRGPGIAWGNHDSWTSNNGSDQTPVCDQTYGPTQLPFLYPWWGETFCFSTNTNPSTTAWRQAYMWNTYSGPDFNVNGGIGSLSSDGNWYGINSDWWCTLGVMGSMTVAPTTATNQCAQMFWANHAYTVGQYMATTILNTQMLLYQVTTAGTTSATPPTSSQYCSTSGCTISNGGVTFTFVTSQTGPGYSTVPTIGGVSVFLIHLQ